MSDRNKNKKLKYTLMYLRREAQFRPLACLALVLESGHVDILLPPISKHGHIHLAKHTPINKELRITQSISSS